MGENGSGYEHGGEEQERIVVEAILDERIEQLAVRMCAAVKENSFVTSTFKGIEIVIGGGDTPDSIADKYDEAKNKGLTSTEQLFVDKGKN